MRKMDAHSDAIPRFVSRMFEAPALKALPALQKEEQALQFLKANGAQLQPLLASMGIAALTTSDRPESVIVDMP